MYDLEHSESRTLCSSHCAAQLGRAGARAPAPTDYKEEEEGAQPERPSKGYSLRRHLRAVLVRPQLQATPTATWRPLAGNLWAAGRFLKLPIDRSIDRPEREAASHRTLSKRRSAIAILSSEKSRRAMQWAWAAAARRYRGPIRPPGKPETVAVARSSLPLTASLLQEEGAVGEGGHGTGYLGMASFTGCSYVRLPGLASPRSHDSVARCRAVDAPHLNPSPSGEYARLLVRNAPAKSGRNDALLYRLA